MMVIVSILMGAPILFLLLRLRDIRFTWLMIAAVFIGTTVSLYALRSPNTGITTFDLATG